jgi:type I restriction enzyme S subunit
MKTLALSTKTTRLDELGFVSRGRSRHRPRNDASLYGGEYPFFQTGDIKAANLYLTDYTQTYSEAGLAQSKMWDTGTLCITIAANIAETAILGIPGCFPDSVVGFIPDPEKADVRFIKYYIDILKLGMQSISRGTTQDNMSVEKLMSFDFDVPDLNTQRKIAGILSAYDDLIENNLRRIKILEEMAQSLYREWFVHFRFPGHESAKFVDSELGQIPHGWEVKPLKDSLDFINEGETAGPHLDDVPYLPIDCLPRHSLAVMERRPGCEAQSSLIRFKKHDILFGAMRCYFHKVVIAPFDGTTRKTCFVFRAKERTNYSWALLTLFQEDTIAYASNHSKGATIPYAVWEGSLAEMKIIKPPGDLCRRFDELVWPMLERIAGAHSRNKNLCQTRDLLLPKLLQS